MFCDQRPIKRAKITLGERGFFTNYLSDVVMVINGCPVTKSDILAAKRKRQARELAAKRKVQGLVMKPAFVWVFFNRSWLYSGWYLYIRTAKKAFWLRVCYDEEMILKIMAAWPCGCLPFIENLRTWMSAFARQYHRSTRKRPDRQGMVICWVGIEGGRLVDVYKKR